MSYVIVDEMHEEHPEMLRDAYWDEVFPAELPYTAATKQFQTEPPQGSTKNVEVPVHMADFVKDAVQDDGEARTSASADRAASSRKGVIQTLCILPEGEGGHRGRYALGGGSGAHASLLERLRALWAVRPGRRPPAQQDVRAQRAGQGVPPRGQCQGPGYGGGGVRSSANPRRRDQPPLLHSPLYVARGERPQQRRVLAEPCGVRRCSAGGGRHRAGPRVRVAGLQQSDPRRQRLPGASKGLLCFQAVLEGLQGLEAL